MAEERCVCVCGFFLIQHGSAVYQCTSWVEVISRNIDQASSGIQYAAEERGEWIYNDTPGTNVIQMYAMSCFQFVKRLSVG